MVVVEEVVGEGGGEVEVGEREGRGCCGGKSDVAAGR